MHALAHARYPTIRRLITSEDGPERRAPSPLYQRTSTPSSHDKSRFRHVSRRSGQHAARTAAHPRSMEGRANAPNQVCRRQCSRDLKGRHTMQTSRADSVPCLQRAFAQDSPIPSSEKWLQKSPCVAGSDSLASPPFLRSSTFKRSILKGFLCVFLGGRGIPGRPSKFTARAPMPVRLSGCRCHWVPLFPPPPLSLSFQVPFGPIASRASDFRRASTFKMGSRRRVPNPRRLNPRLASGASSAARFSGCPTRVREDAGGTSQRGSSGLNLGMCVQVRRIAIFTISK